MRLCVTKRINYFAKSVQCQKRKLSTTTTTTTTTIHSVDQGQFPQSVGNPESVSGQSFIICKFNARIIQNVKFGIYDTVQCTVS